MANLVEILIRGKDEASATLGKTKDAISHIGKEAGAVGPQAQKLGAALGQVGTDAATAISPTKGLLDSVGRMAVAFGGAQIAISALRGAFTGTIGATIGFDTAMRNVQSIAKLSGDEFNQLQKSTLGLVTSGQSAGQSAVTLARGLYDLYSSGFQGEAALEAVRVAAQGAAAGLTTTEISTRVLAAVMNAWGTATYSAKDAMDILFKGVEVGVFTFGELAQSMGLVVPTAAALGVSLEETVAAMAEMTRNGMDASMAATSLNGILSAILKPSHEATKLANQLGIEWDTDALKAKGLNGVMADMIQKTGGASDKMGVLLGDARAIRGAFVLAKEGGAGYVKALEQMKTASEGAGATAAALAEQKKAVAFQVRELTTKLQALGIEGLQPLLRALLPLVSGLSDVVAFFQKTKEAQIGLTAAVVAFLALRFGPVIVSMATGLGQAAAAMVGLGTASTGATVGVAGLGIALKAAGIGLIIGAIAILVEKFDLLRPKLAEAAGAGGLVEEAFRRARLEASEFGTALPELQLRNLVAVLKETTGEQQAVNRALDEAPGPLERVKLAFTSLGFVTGEHKRQLQELRERKGELAKIVPELTKAILDQGASWADLVKAAEAAGLTEAELRELLPGVAEEIDKLRAGVAEARVGQEAYTQAVKFSDEALKTFQKTSTDALEAIRETVAAVLPDIKMKFDEWKKSIEEQVQAHASMESNLALVYSSIREMGVTTAAELVRAVATKGPLYAAHFAQFFQKDPEAALALLQKAAPLMVGETVDSIVARVLAAESETEAAWGITLADTLQKVMDVAKQEGPGAALALIQEIAAQIEEGATETDKALVTALLEPLRTQLEAAVAEAKAGGKRAGGALTLGIEEGIEAGKQSLFGVIGLLTSDAVLAIEEHLGAESPAKRLIPAGRSIPEGLAVGIEEGTPELLAAAKQALEEALRQLEVGVTVGAASERLLRIGHGLVELIGKGVDESASDLAASLRDMVARISEGFDVPAIELAQLGREILAALADGLLSASPELASAARRLAQGFVDAWTEEVLKEAKVDWIASLGRLAADIALGADPKFRDIGRDLIRFLQSGVLDSTPALYAEVLNLVHKIADGLATTVDFTAIGQLLIDALRTGVLAESPATVDQVLRLIEDIAKALESLGPKAKATGSKAGKGTIEGIIAGLDAELYKAEIAMLKAYKVITEPLGTPLASAGQAGGAGAVTGVATGISTTASVAAGAAKTAGEVISGSMKEGIWTFLNRWWEFTQVVQQVIAMLGQSMQQWGRPIGLDFAMSVAAGIQSGTGSVIAAAVNMVLQAIAAARAAAQSASPSKVFQALGEEVAGGYALGIVGRSPLAGLAARGMVEQAVAGATIDRSDRRNFGPISVDITINGPGEPRVVRRAVEEGLHRALRLRGAVL